MPCYAIVCCFLESLKFSSAVSTLLAVAFVTICTVLAIVAIVEGRTQSPRLIPCLDQHTSFFDLFTAVPVVVTAYTFHFNGTYLITYLPLCYITPPLNFKAPKDLIADNCFNLNLQCIQLGLSLPSHQKWQQRFE